jgi:hypothetical protein
MINNWKDLIINEVEKKKQNSIGFCKVNKLLYANNNSATILIEYEISVMHIYFTKILFE